MSDDLVVRDLFTFSDQHLHLKAAADQIEKTPRGDIRGFDL
ncbi:MAG: hypothetical protein AAFQ24_14180 [Pseudomonadota bacterium]